MFRLIIIFQSLFAELRREAAQCNDRSLRFGFQMHLSGGILSVCTFVNINSWVSVRANLEKLETCLENGATARRMSN